MAIGHCVQTAWTNRPLTQEIQLSKTFIQVSPTKKSDITYSTLYSLVQVWASVTETESGVTTRNMIVHVYLQSLWHKFTQTKCANTKTQCHSASHKRHSPLKPFHIKDFLLLQNNSREIRRYSMYSWRLHTYQLGSGNITCTITTYVNIKMWAPSHYSWIQMYNISFNVSV